MYGIKDNQISELDDNEIDYDLPSPNSFFGSHVNLIPLQNAVQGPRLFYGARFYNQAMPVSDPQAPFVQNLIDGDEKGRSFDELFGKDAGAVFANEKGRVLNITPDEIEYETITGEKKKVDLYNQFPFNRKTALHNTSLVKVGDEFDAGSILAKSNYTDDKGTLAMGKNARVGVVPYKGFSMDDAIVISEDFARSLASEHTYTTTQDYDRDIKSGRNHYTNLFPTKFKKTQIETLDDEGVVKPGTILQPDDPMILATAPKMLSSSTSQIGKLSKVMRQARRDASTIWDHEEPGEVIDVVKGKKGVKVITRSLAPTQEGDKIVFRSGQKGIVSKIIPSDQMPRTTDGKLLDVLLNPLGIPSRANNSIIYELLMGKLAEASGQPIKVPGFNKKGEQWYDTVRQKLKEAGLSDVEEVFDPINNKKLENPITVGNGYVLKLHHTGSSKVSARGQSGYDINEQPLKGGSAGGQAKRLSGLEVHSLLSAGAYKTLREGSTLRGQKNDEYWRRLRQGHSPKPTGEPFAWKKFQALLQGAGMRTADRGNGVLRLGPMTDKDLDPYKPIEIRNEKLVDSRSLDGVPGGLFDPALISGNSWGEIKLPFAVPNPAFERQVANLLGLTMKDMRSVLAGQKTLEEVKDKR
jgi:DNA-directed RNA polymerase subunit beta